MTGLAETLSASAADTPWSGGLIDCDVHVEASLEAIAPYMEDGPRQWMRERGYPGPLGAQAVYPAAAPSSVRPEWRQADGRRPGATLEQLQQQVLDPFETQRAILNCYWALDSTRHPDLTVWLARAVNDWLIDQWLDRDDRLRASIVLPPHTLADAVAEIHRVGSHPGFVQVMMPVRTWQAYGRRNWWPLYEAIVEHDLVCGLQWGGTSESPKSSGHTSWYIQEYVDEQQAFMAQLLSMVTEGLFQKFPTLRVAVSEIGFAWVPSMLWRMDADWKGLRRVTPWLDRLPSEVVRDHVRFTTAPLDAGPPEQLAQIIEWVGEDMLMFATDYPHNHQSDPRVLLDALSPDGRAKVMSENARAFYRL